MAITMCAAMGGRLHESSLMTDARQQSLSCSRVPGRSGRVCEEEAYRFLVTWVCICGAGFCWLFLFCQARVSVKECGRAWSCRTAAFSLVLTAVLQVFRFLEVHTEVAPLSTQQSSVCLGHSPRRWCWVPSLTTACLGLDHPEDVPLAKVAADYVVGVRSPA